MDDGNGGEDQPTEHQAGVLWGLTEPASTPATEPKPQARAGFDEAALVRARERIRPRGLRALADRLLGRGETGERPWERDLRRCRTAVPGGRRIAVVSRKGGVGKTTTALMLGHTFAAARQDRVLAIDGNPDAGSLGHRVERQTPATVLDALAAVGRLSGYPDVRRLTSQAVSRLEVLASPEDPHASRAMGGREYQEVMDELHRHYSLLICDTGTGILDDATLGILDAVDQIVLVAGPALDSARAAGMTLDWLDANGRARLVRDAVVVINGVDPDGSGVTGRVDLLGLTRHFVERTRVVHHVPHDPHLEAGSVTDPDALTRTSQAAWLGVAASVADGFTLPSPRDPVPPHLGTPTGVHTDMQTDAPPDTHAVAHADTHADAHADTHADSPPDTPTDTPADSAAEPAAGTEPA